MATGFNPNNRSALNPLLKWLWDILAMFSNEEIKVPADFPSQADDVRKVLLSDTSGIVNSILDFAIECALVDYTIETTNKNLTTSLEDWKSNINGDLRGKIPTGLTALAYQYFRERWKGSSLLVLRTIWEEVDGLQLPTKMWFLDGINVIVEDSNNNNRVIGEEEYYIRVDKDKKKKLPATEDEKIFVQKPFSSWNPLYPVPFLIQRGLWKNLKVLELVSSKGEKVIGKALEYLLLIKKGSEQLALTGKPEFIYNETDLTNIKNNFSDFINKSRVEPGIPTHVTNFDTSFEHLIPDFSKIFGDNLFAPIEKRLLAGLGLVEIVEGVASTRREGILNPKPFITEVRNGINDFKMLLNDIIETIMEKNSIGHKKLTANDVKIYSSPIKPFVDDGIRVHMRSMYDRGVICKQTYAEVCGADVVFPIEVQRREKETMDNLDIKMYAPIIDNREGVGIDYPDDTAKPEKLKPLLPKSMQNKSPIPGIPAKKETIPTSKKGPEKKNFKSTLDEEMEEDGELNEENFIIEAKEYEEAPYKTIQELPKSVKVLPSAAQSLWRRVFNKSYPKGEDYARKVAWTVVKQSYHKDGDKWIKSDINE